MAAAHRRCDAWPPGWAEAWSRSRGRSSRPDTRTRCPAACATAGPHGGQPSRPWHDRCGGSQWASWRTQKPRVVSGCESEVQPEHAQDGGQLVEAKAALAGFDRVHEPGRAAGQFREVELVQSQRLAPFTDSPGEGIEERFG